MKLVVVESELNILSYTRQNPDSKVHGANMGPIWGRQDPGGPSVGPMNFAIWDAIWTHVVTARVKLMLPISVPLYVNWMQSLPFKVEKQSNDM